LTRIIEHINTIHFVLTNIMIFIFNLIYYHVFNQELKNENTYTFVRNYL